MRVLLTGFEPFGVLATNVSWEVARRVADAELGAVNLTVEQMPVSFERVAEALRDAVERHNPDIILSLGQSGSGDSIRLERLARNTMNARNADNDGYRPESVPILKDGNDALYCSLTIEQLRSAIVSKGIGATISDSCGLYVCNRLYYEALLIERERHRPKALFVHLPYYTGQQGVARDRATMPLESMTETVKTIIQTLYEDFRI